ncbi:MAG: tetratricopeptide repeat protein [Sandaracinus sp.]|nr:tetratricopeptide repeat protein [Sandaracinus sp.]
MSEAKRTDDANESEGAKERRMPKRGAKSSRPPKKNADKGEAKSESKAEAEASGEPRWLCVHCGHRFAADEAPDRCPSCMRKGGLEALAAGAKSGRPAWVMPVAVVVLVGLVGGGYALWAKSTPDPVSGEVPMHPLELSELRGYLAVDNADGEHARLFEVDDAVEALAEHATGGSAKAKAEALVEHVRARATAGAFEPWALDSPRDTAIERAPEVAAHLAETERAHLYPLEVAVVTVAALREAGVDAMVAEVWGYPGDRRPPDPSGRLGYFGVAVWDGDLEGDPTTILDPYLGRATEPEEGRFRVLDDVKVVAAFLGAQALHALVHENDSTAALSKVQRAIRLDGRSPALRSVQAAVLIANGGLQQGVEELQAATQLRSDGPRRNNVAGVFMAMSDFEQANREVAAALEEFPDFAGAHATLGAIHLAQGETDLAQTELEAAERLEPQTLILPMLWAEYHLRSGDSDRAASYAREAVERRPQDWQTRLGAARVFRAAGRYDDMRRQAHAVMDLVPEAQREPMRQQIEALLGPTALEPLDDEEEVAGDDDFGDDDFGDDDDLGLGDPGGFQLGSSLLGEGDTSMSPGLLGGGDDEEEGGPALMLGDPNSFSLGGGGGSSSSMLRLNL